MKDQYEKMLFDKSDADLQTIIYSKNSYEAEVIEAAQEELHYRSAIKGLKNYSSFLDPEILKLLKRERIFPYNVNNAIKEEAIKRNLFMGKQIQKDPDRNSVRMNDSIKNNSSSYSNFSNQNVREPHKENEIKSDDTIRNNTAYRAVNNDQNINDRTNNNSKGTENMEVNKTLAGGQNAMYLLPNEEIKMVSKYNIVTLTNYRIHMNSNTLIGDSFSIIIFLEDISSIEVKHKSYIIFLIIAVLTLGASLAYNQRNENLIGGVVGFLFWFGIWWLTRRHIIAIASKGGSVMNIIAKAVIDNKISDFINKVLLAKQLRVNQLSRI